MNLFSVLVQHISLQFDTILVIIQLEGDLKTLISKHMDKKPTKGEYLEVLLRSPKTIFSTKDVALLWNENDNLVIIDRLKRYVRVGKLIRLRRGFYAKDKNYNRFE